MPRTVQNKLFHPDLYFFSEKTSKKEQWRKRVNFSAVTWCPTLRSPLGCTVSTQSAPEAPPCTLGNRWGSQRVSIAVRWNESADSRSAWTWGWLSWRECRPRLSRTRPSDWLLPMTITDTKVHCFDRFTTFFGFRYHFFPFHCDSFFSNIPPLHFNSYQREIFRGFSNFRTASFLRRNEKKGSRIISILNKRKKCRFGLIDAVF